MRRRLLTLIAPWPTSCRGVPRPAARAAILTRPCKVYGLETPERIAPPAGAACPPCGPRGGAFGVNDRRPDDRSWCARCICAYGTESYNHHSQQPCARARQYHLINKRRMPGRWPGHVAAASRRRPRQAAWKRRPVSTSSVEGWDCGHAARVLSTLWCAEEGRPAAARCRRVRGHRLSAASGDERCLVLAVSSTPYESDVERVDAIRRKMGLKPGSSLAP